MPLHIEDIPAKDRLKLLGWSDAWQARHLPMRVVGVERKGYLVWGAVGERRALLPGRRQSHPTTGDWVDVIDSGNNSEVRIQSLLPRQNSLTRKSGNRLQSLCANIDVAITLVAANTRLNMTRLERYLAMTTQSGIRTLVVLSWADKAKDLPRLARSVRQLAPDSGVYALDTRSARAAKELLLAGCLKGRTSVMVGASGTGKSTLVNSLLGDRVQRTAPVRLKDSKGRHTTTHRSLLLGEGFSIIDIPGLRGLNPLVDKSELFRLFPDLLTLIQQCRYRNCRHGDEPGCAIQQALAAGTLSFRRWQSFSSIVKID